MKPFVSALSVCVFCEVALCKLSFKLPQCYAELLMHIGSQPSQTHKKWSYCVACVQLKNLRCWLWTHRWHCTDSLCLQDASKYCISHSHSHSHLCCAGLHWVSVSVPSWPSSCCWPLLGCCVVPVVFWWGASLHHQGTGLQTVGADVCWRE